ncbi:MAG: gluconokinase, partial [Acetobacteraceae bacterium]|nr:gluconokinase [Acetobacteraceae bacterium]
AARKDHFMPPGLLASQFAALEPPGLDERPLIVAIDQAPDVMVAKLVVAFSSSAI